MEENTIEDLNKILSDPETEVDVLLDDSIINLTISGAFAKRIQILLDYFVNSKSPEEILKVYSTIMEENNQHTYDLFTFHVETVLVLMKEIHKSATEVNAFKKVKMKDLDTPQ
jgi:hypothetical protein